MKRLSEEPFKKWFGYTRRERRSSLVLLLIIISVAGVRYLIPGRESDIEIIPLNYSETSINESSPEKNETIIPGALDTRSSVTRPKRGLLEINTCDSASLESLPGIGPVLSVRILKYRKLLGGFASVNQLLEVYGLSPETFNLISAMLKVDSSLVKKIKINIADYKQLLRMPYLDKTDVSAILKYRDLNGRITGMDELIENKLIAAEKANKIRPYLEF